MRMPIQAHFGTRLCSSLCRALLWLGWLAPACLWSAPADELRRIESATLLDAPANDGDSFKIATPQGQLTIRLYFVDCPECGANAAEDSVIERLREQKNYFALTHIKDVIVFGEQARVFTRAALSNAFTVHTAFAGAGGASKGGRVYAFITLADGRDLAAELVKGGLARVVGVGRQGPGGKSAKEIEAGLRDCEAAAMLAKAGIWARSMPEQLVEERRKKREERQQDHKELGDALEKAQYERPAEASADQRPPAATSALDLNTATREELEALPGIGPSLAAAIIASRPYRTVDDLAKVKGIGPALPERLRPVVRVAP